MSVGQVESVQEWGEANQANGLPLVVLPSGTVTITECAEQLFGLIGPTRRLFVRGGAVVSLTTRDDGLLALEVVRPAAARSLFEKFGRFLVWRVGANDEAVLKPTVCAQQMAEALLQCQEAETMLPRVQGLMNCPVLREADGELAVAGPGYDEQTRMLVTAGALPPVVTLDEAVPALLGLLAEFDFQSDGDLARAIASLISPALQAGGFLRSRVPAEVAEADQSQSGKTYRQKVIAAVYNERVSLVTSRVGGVGSIDESLNQALVAGRPFIQMDNFRGRFESTHLEGFLTAEGSFSCRVPYRGDVTVPPESYFVFLTSNGVDTTRDLANRSNIIRIRKKAAGFVFRKYAEGDLLTHVRAQQAYYLGCVFAVVRHWHSLGKQRSDETRHDFRDWAQVVDWIGQRIFGTVPVMEGHREAQERVSNPSLVWLRSVALTIEQNGDLNRPLIASDILSLCENADIAIPGLRPGTEADKAKKLIGIIMAKLFRESDSLDLGDFRVVREEKFVARDNVNAGGGFKSKTYTVTRQ